jgi:hypothetical protein
VTGRPQSRDSFAQVETVDGVVPGSGPVAITTRVSLGPCLTSARE